MLLARAPDLCSPMKRAACMKLPYALFGILSLTLTFHCPSHRCDMYDWEDLGNQGKKWEIPT
jgi:hypothetical protein